MPWRILDNDAILTALAAVKSTSINNGGTVLPAATSLYDALTFKFQSPIVIQIVHPVQNTWYTILPTTMNCRLIGFQTMIETLLESVNIRLTLDGVVLTNSGDQIAGASYFGYFDSSGGLRVGTTDISAYRAFLIEARSIKLEIQKTTANGDNPFDCWVNYAIR
jgi:hypothetical protein